MMFVEHVIASLDAFQAEAISNSLRETAASGYRPPRSDVNRLKGHNG